VAPRCGDYQLAGFDAFGAQDHVGHVMHQAGFTAQDYHLKAAVLVNVYMRCTYNVLTIVVLNGVQLVLQVN
jgi:hypothetical protein